MKRSIELLAVAAALACAAAAQDAAAAEARCNIMLFFDGKGAPLPTPAPVIGMMVGDKAVYEAEMPAASAVKPGAEAPCPKSIVDGVRSTFEMSCMSEQRRRQAAVDHKVDSKVIDKGCTDIIAAMGSSLEAPK